MRTHASLIQCVEKKKTHNTPRNYDDFHFFFGDKKKMHGK